MQLYQEPGVDIAEIRRTQGLLPDYRREEPQGDLEEYIHFGREFTLLNRTLSRPC